MAMTNLSKYLKKKPSLGSKPMADMTGHNKSKMSGFKQHPGFDAVSGGKRAMKGYGHGKGDYPGMGAKTMVDTERKQDN